MTRTKKIVAIMLAVLVLSALAFAGVAGAKDKDEGSGTFTLAAVNEDGLSFVGWTTSVDALERLDGTPIDGYAGGRCAQVGSVDEYMCDMVFRLPEGDITLAGLVEMDSTDPWVFAVTGGTGQFRSARGEAESVLYTYDPFVVHFTFRLKGASADY